VAGFLIGGAGTTIALNPATYPSGGPIVDPANIPPPDPRAGAEPPPQTADRAPLVPAQGVGSMAVVETGTCVASYYSDWARTASGEAFDPAEHTAAHETLPFGTQVRVTSTASGESVLVRINDRGPYYQGRCLDLSAAAFAMIADPADGVAEVRYEVLALASA
jgi:rare lipoprotein A